MPTTYVELAYWQVGLAALLMSINGGLSTWLQLGMERWLLIASLRTLVQLLLIGFVLEWVFSVNRWYVVLGLLCVMTLVACVTAVQRTERKFPGCWLNMLVSLWASSWLVTAFALWVVIRGMEAWYQPQYCVPLLGMVLGNTLNGVSLGINTLTEILVTRRGEVETLLALGATRWEAARQPIQQAMKTGMTPIINSMMIVGVVSLPGMMTGQILSGASPIQAVKYQIVIMFLVASATALGTAAIVLLTYLRLFSPRHQFRHAALETGRGF